MTLVQNRKLTEKTLEELLHEGHVRIDDCEDYHISDDLSKEIYNEILLTPIVIRPKKFRYGKKEDFKFSIGCINLVAESIRCDDCISIHCSDNVVRIAHVYSELPSSLEFQINGSNNVYFDNNITKRNIYSAIADTTPDTFIQ